MSAADVFEGLCPARPEVGMPAYVFYILIAIASLIGTLITIVGTQKFWEYQIMEDHRFKSLVVQNNVQGENIKILVKATEMQEEKIKILVKQTESQAAHIVMLEKKCAYNEEKSTL